MTCTRPWWVATISVLGMLAVPQSDAGGFSVDECAVWTRELSFAGTVARHDAEAFAGHLEPEAVFGAGSQNRTRGREAIVERWRRIIEGKQVTIEWYPTRTTVGGVDGIAWSEGPALVVTEPGTPDEAYRLGRFRSILALVVFASSTSARFTRFWECASSASVASVAAVASPLATKSLATSVFPALSRKSLRFPTRPPSELGWRRLRMPSPNMWISTRRRRILIKSSISCCVAKW